jgi:hypothetical protein
VHSFEVLPRKEDDFQFVEKSTTSLGVDVLGKKEWTLLLRLGQEF